MSFQIDFINFSEQIIPTLTTELIGHFNIDSDLQYHAVHKKLYIQEI